MRPFIADGDVWRVIRVPAGDPRLIDRTGSERLATTDPHTRTIAVLDTVQPPLLDRVMLHEVAHAVTMSSDLLPELGRMVKDGDVIGVEEWAARLVEGHAIETIDAASAALGRPICVEGLCSGRRKKACAKRH